MMKNSPFPYDSAAHTSFGADDHRAVPCCRIATFLPALLAAGLAAGVVPGALAAPPANKVWGDCQLTQEAIDGIVASLESTGGVPSGNGKVDFVVVYTLQNPNDGQKLGVEGGPSFTGPVLCANTTNVDIASTEENTPIPKDSDPETTVDIKALEQALIVQYDQAGIRKRFCHTVANKNQCFLIRTPVGD